MIGKIALFGQMSHSKCAILPILCHRNWTMEKILIITIAVVSSALLAFMFVDSLVNIINIFKRGKEETISEPNENDDVVEK